MPGKHSKGGRRNAPPERFMWTPLRFIRLNERMHNVPPKERLEKQPSERGDISKPRYRRVRFRRD